MHHNTRPQYSGYTMIDDLPDVYDPRQQQGPTPSYSNMIRNHSRSSVPESGMEHYTPQHQQPPQQMSYQPPPPQQGMMDMDIIEPPSSMNRPVCLDICDHIRTCPLCSRFYKPNTTIYIVIIAILIVICLMLMKKVLSI